MSRIVEAAPAKLNLYLHVLGKRADGYHLLDSLIAFASIHDLVAVVPGDDLTLELAGPFGAALAADSGNLVLRAARGLAAAAGIAPRAKITLVKNLPIASGVGGGSADAAAALRALVRLWHLEMTCEDMMALALNLGADVPMCLAGRPAFVGGIGDLLTPIPPLPPAGLLLVNPGVPLATPDVFAARADAFSKAGRFAERPGNALALAALLAERRNDLTIPARKIYPVVGEVLAALDGVPGSRLARMSGSGATCFALFDDEAAACAAAAQVARPGWWVASGRLLSEPMTSAAHIPPA